MIAARHVVERVALNEVEVESVDGIGPPAGAVSAVAEGHERAAVEQDSIAARGNEVRDHGLHVLLVEVAGAAAQVSVALLVRAEAEDGFIGSEDKLQARLEAHAVEHGFGFGCGGARSIDALLEGDGGVFGKDVPADLFADEVLASSFRLPREKFAGRGE